MNSKYEIEVEFLNFLMMMLIEFFNPLPKLNWDCNDDNLVVDHRNSFI